MEEVWKPIKGYGGMYEISNAGRVKGLERKRWNGKCWVIKPERILKPGYTNGYPKVILSVNGNHKNAKIHLLVWDAFGDKPRNGHKLQVDHKDNNRRNPKIDNLQLLDNRHNQIKDIRKRKKNSEHIGVSSYLSQDKKRTYYVARIYVNGKSRVIGHSRNEIDLVNVYKQAKGELE